VKRRENGNGDKLICVGGCELRLDDDDAGRGHALDERAAN